MRLKISKKKLDEAIRALGMTIKDMCKRSRIDSSRYYRYRKDGSMTIGMMAKINEGTGIDPVAYVPYFTKRLKERR